MIFLVCIGYNTFKFNDKQDAVIFAEIAKAHAVDPDDCIVKIEILTANEKNLNLRGECKYEFIH